MMNLIKSDLFKLKKEKSVKVILVLIAIFLALQIVINLFIDKSDMVGYAIGRSSFLMSLRATDNLGLALPIVIALFLTKEFTYNTVRNKVIWGYSKVKIYLSSIITSTALGVAFFIFNALLTLGLTSLIFGYGVTFTTAEFLFILKELLLASLLFAFMISIMVFIAMVIKNTGMVIGLYFGIVIFCSLLTFVTQIPNVAKWVVDVASWFPFYLDTFVVSGEITQGIILRIIVSSVVLSAGIHFLGIFFFNKIDLK